MEKYSKEWCDKLMADRGYSIHWVSGKSIGYTKWIGEFASDESFVIHATVFLNGEGTAIELSGTPLKMFISISTGKIAIEHPSLDGFEEKIVQYVDACIQSDYTIEAIAERRIKRKAP